MKPMFDFFKVLNELRKKQVNLNTFLLVAVFIGVEEKLTMVNADHNSTMALIQWQADHQRISDTAIKQLDDVRMGQDAMRQDIYSVKNDVGSLKRQMAAATNRVNAIERKIGL